MIWAIIIENTIICETQDPSQIKYDMSSTEGRVSIICIVASSVKYDVQKTF